ncbi:hypothetical protein C8J57DRAFT_1254146 [Mycena rebaudengoi]|nr:hypothetical protein C8J57DRAFT_1254146 [Mycena rebaudengoi]
MDDDMARRIVLSNACLWKKDDDLNNGPNAPHLPVPLNTLYELLLADSPLSQDEETSVLVAYKDHCTMIRQGALRSCLAGNADIDVYDQLMRHQGDRAAFVLQEIERVTNNVCNQLYFLYDSMGVHSILITHPQAILHYRRLLLESEGSDRFIRDVLNMEPKHLSQLFKHWSLLQFMV